MNMSTSSQEESNLKEVASELLKQAKTFTKQVTSEDIKSGEWFLKLLYAVMKAYDRNARPDYLRQKYPGLSDDEIADKLISITTRVAAISGAVTGTASAANQAAIFASGGAFLISIAGVEMIGLTQRNNKRYFLSYL